MVEPLLLTAHNPSPMTGDGNNTYLLAQTGGSAALIDAGVGEPAHLQAIAGALADRHARLDTVLVTHGHRDHASGAPALTAQHPAASFAKHPWPEEDAQYAVAWRTIADGDRVSAGGEPLVVLHTPGHSPDHLAFWHEPSRTLFTGDLVVRGSSVMIHSSRGGNLAQYLASLERLLALEPARLLPAHGPIVDDPRVVIAGYIAHRLFRERQVEAALRAGRTTVEAIAESIYDGLAPALMPAARENVRAHLEKLEDEGRASEAGGHWQP
ncbi:MAG TPA: MBL fold metallo-hydrolase [Vicinamibacterales bacterium]|nr:MBL fold metallo-hydrolase [Vicinamibacterales bacterium]